MYVQGVKNYCRAVNKQQTVQTISTLNTFAVTRNDTSIIPIYSNNLTNVIINECLKITALIDTGVFLYCGVTRIKAQEFSTNVALVASKAYLSSAALLRSFRSRYNKVLWTTFTAYVLPMLNYASLSWKHYLKRDVNLLENFQRRCTRRMWGQRDRPYAEHWSCLSA